MRNGGLCLELLMESPGTVLVWGYNLFHPPFPRGSGNRRILAGCCFTELKSFGILACFRAFPHLQHTGLR